MKTESIEVEPCPFCGCKCYLTNPEGTGVVHCSECSYRSSDDDDEVITAHNELCRRKPVQNLPRMVEVSQNGLKWSQRRLVVIVDNSAEPYITVSEGRTEPYCWLYMREIPAAPKRVPLEFDDYRENRDMWLKWKRNGDNFRITGLLSKSKKILVGVTYYDCEGLHTEFTHIDGTPLEKDAE